MNPTTERKTMNIEFPQINESERHVATIVKPDGTGFHLIRMATMPTNGMNWKDTMQFVKDAGGELPDCVESALLFQTQQPNEFQSDWYWTREQDAGCESYAWVQHFGNGYRYDVHKDNEYRVVLVRRVAI